MSSPRRFLALIAALACAVAGLSACSPSAPQPRSDVGVQLFQWTWNAIAIECTDELGPAGYGWVLTSPPQEHILGDAWWTAYQPVSYLVESRLGTREEFEAMVSQCRDAGVEVIADAVVNHMTGQDSPGVGWAGSTYEHYEYPGIYGESDFHHCTATPNGDISDYTDADQVRTCELVNLADLATETEHVRATINAYLEDLLSLGVAGFRIDAAKHLAPADVAAFLEGLPADTRVMQEVIGASGEPIKPTDFVDNGQVFDFAFGQQADLAMEIGQPEHILEIGSQFSGLTSEQAVVFVDNHDTERNGSTLSYHDDAAYQQAVILMLAGTYGTPVVFSGYAFGQLETDLGPAQDSTGAVVDATCPATAGLAFADEAEDQTWLCQHRWAPITGMVGWRIAAGDAELEDVVAQDGALTLRRGDAVLLLNSGDEPVTLTMATSLEPGEYCDVLSGELAQDGCTGETVTVGEGGVVSAEVAAGSAVATYPGAKP